VPGWWSSPSITNTSGHRAYLGLERPGIVDVDPVLRHFGVKKTVARERYAQFVAAGMKLGHQAELYPTDEGRILGTEEFVDATIHRIGETRRTPRVNDQNIISDAGELKINRLIAAVEKVCRVPREEFYGPGKNARSVLAKEMLILIGYQLGASLKLLSEVTGLSSGSVSRRRDAARIKIRENGEMMRLVARIRKLYHCPND
jgi:hypothetical protein